MRAFPEASALAPGAARRAALRWAVVGMAVLAMLPGAVARAAAFAPGTSDPSWNHPQLPGVTAAAPTHGGGLTVVTPSGLMRLGPTGDVDRSFGAGGTATLPFPPDWIGSDSDDDGVFVVGRHGTTWNAAHYLASGAPDPNFGAEGVVDTGAFGSFPYVDGTNLLLQRGAALERLSANGGVDPDFNGGRPVGIAGAAPGPLTRDALLNAYDVIVPTCAEPGPCPMNLIKVAADGSIISTVAVRGPSFAPEGIDTAFQFAFHGVLVVGQQHEEMVGADGNLVSTFGQGRCGDPLGNPTMVDGALSLLADGRTVDLSTPAANFFTDRYDIAAHAFVRYLGRKDTNVAHIIFPPGDHAAFLTSTDGAMWFALSPVLTGQPPVTITKIALAPTPAAATFGPPATYGDWVITDDGGVLGVPPIFGSAPAFCGSLGGAPLAQPIVGAAEAPDGVGYWLVGRDGGVFNFGDAVFVGSAGGTRLNEPIVGMAATPDGGGYWLVASDGGVFSFGDAGFFGSTGAMRLNQPIVGMQPSSDGEGYWLVARDGGIFTFGDARFMGSAGGTPLNAPIVGMLRTRSGNGYWLAASDGGIFTYGDAGYGDVRAAAPVVGIAPGVPDTFTVVSSDGRVFNSDFGRFPQPAIAAHPVVAVISAG